MQSLAAKLTVITTLLVSIVWSGVALCATPESWWVPPAPAQVELPEAVSYTSLSTETNDVESPSPNWPTTAALPASFDSEMPPFLIDGPLSQSGWFARGESLFLHLSHSSNQPLVYDLINTGTANAPVIVAAGPVITTNSIAGNQFAAMPRITVGYRFDDGTTVEARYFGLNDWSASAGAASSPAGSPSVIFVATPDGFAADKARTSLATTIQNVEVNSIRNWNRMSSLEFLAGIRYFRLDDQFQVNTQRTANAHLYEGDYNVRATNNLLGGQIGLRWAQSWGNWSLGASSKSGIYVNNVDQFQAFFYSRDSNGLAIRDISMFRSSAAFLQEFGLNGAYQLTSACTIRAGYNLFLINGLARAGNQLDFSANPMPSLTTHGTTVLHGPSAGIEFRF